MKGYKAPPKALLLGTKGPTLTMKPVDFPNKEKAIKVFKVMTQKDCAFGGKFNPEKIEFGSNMGNVEAMLNRQYIPLDELKTALAAKVKAAGGNALDSFKYFQKGTVWSFSSTQLKATGRAMKAQ